MEQALFEEPKEHLEAVEQPTETKELELKKEVQEISIVSVKDQESLNLAIEYQKAIKVKIQKIKDYWEKDIADANKLHKSLTQKRKELLDPCEKFEKQQKDAIDFYLTEQERIRKEAEQKTLLEAQEKERKEKEKLEKKIEKAIEKGDNDKAEILQEQKETISVAPVMPVQIYAKPTGLSVAKDTVVTVLDKKAFLLELLRMQNPPLHLVDVSEGSLKKWVKANDFKSFVGLKIEEKAGSRIR
jgi:hypothetical protein